jgi:dTDP-glucose 4,6-dehydratase
VAARLFGFVGPYMSASNGTAAAEFVELAAQGKQIIVHGTGEALRSYQYASDMARWLVVLYAHGRPGSAYNVGGSDHTSIAALAHQVARVVTPEVTVRITGGRHAGLAPPGSYLPCLKKAESELGLQNIVSLPEAIRRTLQWHSEAA